MWNQLRINLMRPTVRSEIFKKLSSKAGDVTQVKSMEKSFNQVILVGRVGSNPEERGTEEHPVVIFSLATSVLYSRFDTSNEVTQTTDWHRISVFKPFLRERVVNFMTKGSRVMVHGRLSYMERKDAAEAGYSAKTATIIADDVIFMSVKPGQEIS